MRDFHVCALRLAAVALMLITVVRTAAAQPRTSSGKFTDVEGGKIYYEECGTGDEAVLLLRDGVVHSAVWDDVWPAFCQKFHTIRYDRPRLWAVASRHKLVLGNRRLICACEVSEGSPHNARWQFARGRDIDRIRPRASKSCRTTCSGRRSCARLSYSDHFLNRGEATWAATKGDPTAAIAKIADDKYLTAADHPAARKKIRDLLVEHRKISWTMTWLEMSIPPCPACTKSMCRL